MKDYHQNTINLLLGMGKSQPNPTQSLGWDGLGWDLGWVGFLTFGTWVGLGSRPSELGLGWDFFFSTWDAKTWDPTPLGFPSGNPTASLPQRSLTRNSLDNS